MPFEQNPNFTGCKELLGGLKQRLEQKFNTTKKIAIIGLDGVGKTQLMLELAHQIQEQWVVFWIPVNSLANLQTAYHKVAKNLGLPGGEENGVNILESVQTYLSDERNGPWLLVLDNADDVDLWTSPFTSEAGTKQLIDYMPQSKHGAIIWIMRDQKVATTVV